MTRTPAEVRSEIAAVGRLPYGLARTQAAERQVRVVDAEGPESVLAFALTVLVESMQWGGEPEKSFLPFTRLVRWWDERPDLFDAHDQRTMFWQFTWMVTALPDYPTVPAAQIDATLDDMERRYALAGHGRDAVAYSRFLWAWDRAADDVDARYQEWVATPRDQFSQCRVCDPSTRANYLFATGRTQEAVRLVEETLAAGRTCSTQPADMLIRLAGGLLDLGRPQESAAAYRRAVAALARATGEMAAFRGRRIALLGTGGEPARTVVAIEEDAALLLDGRVPGSRLAFLHAVVQGTAALLPEHADLPVRLAEVPASTLGELHAWAATEAAVLGARFDARNGNTGNAEWLAEIRTTRPSPTPLHLDLPDRSPVAPAGRTTATEPEVEPVEAGADQLARAEAEATGGRIEDAAAGYVAAAAAALDAGLLVDAGFAFAEAGRCAETVDDNASADQLYARAVAVLRASGTDPEHLVQVVVAWAPAAALTDNTDAYVEIADAVVESLERGLGAPARETGAVAEWQRAVRRRAVADLHDTTARVLATVGSDEATATAVDRAARAAAAYVRLGAVPEAAHAFWLAGSLLDGQDEVDEAVRNLEAAVEGFAQLGDETSHTEAARELVALLRCDGRVARAEEILATLTR